MLNKGLLGAPASRQDEIVLSQMRVGCTAFSSGPRWGGPGAPVCALCGKPDGPGHALLRCRGLDLQRAQLYARVVQEREEEAAQKCDDDRRNGRPPVVRHIRRDFGASVLSGHPGAVLGFIRDTPFAAWVTARA